ncbi:MAG: DUF2070 family protein [Candidatus Micrarchaeota archaeon]|nr:DUF2070 family protein [Candidatus Micrarchaeota archaeon]
MADSRRYITHYVKYFNLQAPSMTAQTLILLLLGAAAGGFASLIIHLQMLGSGLLQVVALGVSSGIVVVSLPAIITAALIKSIKRKMLLKHAMLATLLITAPYAIVLFVGSASFAITKNAWLSYFFLLLVNAGIYGYWLLIGKFMIGRLRQMALVAAVQPVLNILFYLPLGGYILSFQAPLNLTLVRLFAGMFVFLAMGYALVYLLDRPSKKILEASGMNVIISMISQWLFNLSSDVNVLGQNVGIRRDLDIDVIALRNGDGYKGVFVNPDIHFGPFRGSGGSVVPLSMGRMLAERFRATPFVLHGPLDIQDNPINTSRAYSLSGLVERELRGARKFGRAYGNFAIGESGSCRAVNVSMGDTNLFLLSKAPQVTEDMTRDVGQELRGAAEKASGGDAVMVDAHNSRFESASAQELSGVQKGSVYVGQYEDAIRKAAETGARRRMEFGASHKRLARMLGSPRDLGEGYTSVCVFKFGRKKLCLIYFDANNMLPGFREKLLDHVSRKFRVSVETCTTDTHSINTISSSASMSLGRKTGVDGVIPIIDVMVKEALDSLEPVSYAYRKLKVKDFYVWGEKADMLIERAGAEVRRMIRYIAPLFVAAAFSIAAWVIYVV